MGRPRTECPCPCLSSVCLLRLPSAHSMIDTVTPSQTDSPWLHIGPPDARSLAFNVAGQPSARDLPDSYRPVTYVFPCVSRISGKQGTHLKVCTTCSSSVDEIVVTSLWSTPVAFLAAHKNFPDSNYKREYRDVIPHLRVARDGPPHIQT